MRITGIVCEYNPPHLGHQRQIDLLRQQIGADSALVCIMSGSFVQRGDAAILPKQNRAKAALAMGADLVLELPIGSVLSSAEGFAAGGVEILSRLCDSLCFGAETADAPLLMHTAELLLSPVFSAQLRQELEKGCSFPAARQAALEALGESGEVLTRPNDILAVEYCKAIRAKGLSMDILPISRGGDYHDTTADAAEPSATAVRGLILRREPWENFVPAGAAECLRGGQLHSLRFAERAILGRLRTMTDEEFEALPFGSEGLWRKFMASCRRETGVEAILEATKSKRYTRTRLNRMLLCAWLGLTKADLESTAPYCRVLAFNDKGREILHSHKKSGFFVPVGQPMEDPYWKVEQRVADLYALTAETPEPPRSEESLRVIYQP